MTHLSPDPFFEAADAGQRPERKAAPASVLAAPRMPVTRWNRKFLLAGAGALAAIVGLGFYLGFGGASLGPKKAQDPQAAADTDVPQQPEISKRYAAGYGDPTLRAAETPPGVVTLPPPGGPAPAAAAASSGPPAQAHVDQARVEAAAQADAARAASPFFAGAPGEAAPGPVAPWDQAKTSGRSATQ